ncbi:MAG TPA: glycoside hydrolase family 127 protein, partial [Methylomirabilota bacterium]|nr:glycoside hydrolase family 127 protein [Methylomirabilota bacterium]
RKEWHLVACCPPNVMRTFAALGHYFATRDGSGLQIHLYGPARIAADLTAGSVAVRMESTYPWDGKVRLTIEDPGAKPWTLSLRVPAWCKGASATLDGRAVGTLGAGGYLRIERAWKRGDVVELDLPMPARLTEAHPRIESTRGCVAIERGPLVYCLETADNPDGHVADLEIDTAAPLESTWAPDRLGGVVLVKATGWAVETRPWANQLYRQVGAPPAARRRVALTAVPYYAWANREPGAMRIWIPRGTA